MGTGGKAWEAGREGNIPPTQALAAGTGPGEKQEWRRHLGTGTWMGRGREACRWSCSCTPDTGAPDPTLLTLSTQKGAKALGRQDRRTGREGSGTAHGHLASSYLRTKYRNHAEKNKRRCEREGREKRELMRVLCAVATERAPRAHDGESPRRSATRPHPSSQPSRGKGVTPTLGYRGRGNTGE